MVDVVQEKEPPIPEPQRIEYDGGDKEWVKLTIRQLRLLDGCSGVKKEE